MLVSSIEVFINIKDDVIDETDEEFFVITFDAVAAINLDSISIGTNLSIGKIIDNDRKLITWMIMKSSYCIQF